MSVLVGSELPGQVQQSTNLGPKGSGESLVIESRYFPQSRMDALAKLTTDDKTSKRWGGAEDGTAPDRSEGRSAFQTITAGGEASGCHTSRACQDRYRYQ